MAQPSLLTRLIRYLDYQGAHPSAPFNGSDHDAEHDQIVTVVNQIRNNLGLIQRDDTALKNASVHPDSLSTATKALIAATWTPRGLWVTATAYVVGDMVQNSTTSYVCATAHTAGVFATDYAAGKWLILGETAAAGASAVSFSPAGDIVATDVQAAIEELDAEKAPKNGSASNLFSVNDATGANHAVAMQQIQKNSLVSASGAGTGDAITATLTSGLTVLNDGMAVLIEAPGTNSTTTPTFNLTLGATATSAKTIVKGNNQALVAGDIASNKLHLVYDSSLDKWVLLNPLFAVGQATATTESDSIINLGLSFSVGSSALVASVKTALGANPTASDSVRVAMRSATLATGQYAVRAVTDSTCTLTISSGSTLGHSSGVEGALHWYLIDNAGTLELAVSSKYFGPGGIVSTSAEGGAGGADSATTMYSASARSSVPFRWIGKTLDTQTAAGTWASTPTETTIAHAPVGAEQMDSSAVCVGAQGRLTLTSATPVTSGDVTGATTVYFTPYKGNKVELYDGTGWTLRTFTELSQATTDTTKSPAAVANNSNYDLFVWSDAGTLRCTRGPAWTSDTARGTGAGTTELELLEGRYVNKVAITNGPAAQRGLYVGTVRSDGSAQINDSVAKRHVWNNYNRVMRDMRVAEGTNTWTYTTATLRQANNSAVNQLDYVAGFAEDMIAAEVRALATNSAGVTGVQVGIGIDSTTVDSSQQRGPSIARSDHAVLNHAWWNGTAGIGRHTITWLEFSTATGTTTWYGDNGASALQTGISGQVFA